MEILGYGEDALTLWAITHKMPTLLQMLDDPSPPSRCRVFFRPSFGRRGGVSSPQFGEFDFIILAERRLYLGESKWDKSPKQVREAAVQLAEHQVLRHKVFKLYTELWSTHDYSSWAEFVHDPEVLRVFKKIGKRVAPERSLLASNLQTVLTAIKNRYASEPRIQNVLLYLHSGAHAGQVPTRVYEDFQVVTLDYSEAAADGFVKIKL